MSNKVLCTALVLTLSFGCAACAGTRETPAIAVAKDEIGEASRLTLAAQIINPAPVYNGREAVIGADHAAQAVERYRADKVKQPESPKVSKIAAAQASPN
jgi:hypothetical protein